MSKNAVNRDENKANDNGVVVDNDVDTKSSKFKSFLKSKAFKRTAIILGSVFAVILVLHTVLHFVSEPWRKGEKPMPKFLADLGVYQGVGFEYFDGVSVNGVDLGGKSVKEAKKAVNMAQNNNKEEYEITIVAGDKSCVLKGNDISFTVDSSDALQQAKDYCVSVMHGDAVKTKKDFRAKVILDEEKMSAKLTEIQNALYQAPVNATFKGVDATGVHFEKEKVGVNITLENLKADIENFIAAGNTKGELTATNVPTNPEITVETLSEKIQVIGTCTTTSTASANSTFNMKKAMELCDGSVIEPGATWSFNGCTGNSNLASAGWKSARVISGGKFMDGIGGGICQTSTTIYIAALYANMGVDTRFSHTYPSAYAKKGFDATVDYPAKDLVLRNNSKYPIYMQCIMEGRKLTVKIYGCPDNTYDKITFESNTIKTVPGNYYDMASYRIFWKDGIQIKRERLIDSRYSLKNPNASSSSESSGSSEDPSSSENSSSSESSSSSEGTLIPSTPTTSSESPAPSQPSGTDESAAQ